MDGNGHVSARRAGREVLTRRPACQHADQQHEPHERRAALPAAEQHRPEDDSGGRHDHTATASPAAAATRSRRT